MNTRRFALLVFSALLIFSTPSMSVAEPQVFFWVGGSGNWEDPNNWSFTYGGPGGAGVPTGSYFKGPNIEANLIQSDSTERNVFINDSIGIGTLRIDATGTGNISLNLNQSTSILSVYYSTSALGNNGTGTINQSNGVFLYPEYFYMGVGPSGVGIYNLSGGDVHSSGSSENQIVVGYTGTGIFNQTGGRNYQGWGLVLGWQSGSYGIYNLVNGDLYSGVDSPRPENIGILGTGIFNQSGGYHRVDGTINIGSKGIYNLSGGILEIPDAFAKNSTYIENNGTINYSGGSLNAYIINNNIMNISGSGTRTVNGSIVNNGTVKTTNTIVYYTGTFINNGAYISDPATQYFTDLIIGQNGYLVGQLADAFKISGNLISSSLMNTDWNTRQAFLQFIEGSNNIHDFYLSGADFGAGMPGYANNFAWGTLDVTGNILHFVDGNSEAGAALYLREILGLDITDMLIANLFGFDGLNIYYMANLPDNWFLHGLTYDLAGGGHLRPVPEPGTMILLGCGLVGLVGYGRRRKILK